MKRKVCSIITEALKSQMANEGVISTEDAVRRVEEFILMDEEMLESVIEREARKIVYKCAAQVTDAMGNRIVYLSKNEQAIVNIELCEDVALLKDIEKQLLKLIKGNIRASRKLNMALEHTQMFPFA